MCYNKYIEKRKKEVNTMRTTINLVVNRTDKKVEKTYRTFKEAEAKANELTVATGKDYCAITKWYSI